MLLLHGLLIRAHAQKRHLQDRKAPLCASTCMSMLSLPTSRMHMFCWRTEKVKDNTKMPSSLQGGEDAADLRRYWSMMTRMEPGSLDQNRRPMNMGGGEGVSVSELKRIIELQPLETPAAAAVSSRLALLSPPQFSALLNELARDNHAFRWAHASPHDIATFAWLEAAANSMPSMHTSWTSMRCSRADWMHGLDAVADQCMPQQ